MWSAICSAAIGWALKHAVVGIYNYYYDKNYYN